MIALMGDAELDEGNVFEALLEGWKHDVRNLWWIIDYNRQSLDGVVSDRLFQKIQCLLRNRRLERRHAQIRQAARSRVSPARAAMHLRALDRRLPERSLFRPDLRGRCRLPARARRGLRHGCRHRGAVRVRMTMRRSTALMTNLGGHDMETRARSLRPRRGRRPADLLRRLYDQGLGTCPSPATRTTTPG